MTSFAKNTTLEFINLKFQNEADLPVGKLIQFAWKPITGN